MCATAWMRDRGALHRRRCSPQRLHRTCCSASAAARGSRDLSAQPHARAGLPPTASLTSDGPAPYGAGWRARTPHLGRPYLGAGPRFRREVPRAVPNRISRVAEYASGVVVSFLALLLLQGTQSVLANAQAAPTPAAAPPLRLDSVYALVAARSPRAQAAVALARAAQARVAGAAHPADPDVQLGFMNYTLRV